jgi:hypothetical protein
MHYQRKRELERRFVKEAGMPWSRAKHAVGIVDRALKRWNYQPPACEDEKNLTSPNLGTDAGTKIES